MLDFKALPKQKEFILSNDDSMFVAGYGSGKSHAGTIKTIIRKLQYPKYPVAYYLPNYGLVRDIAFDKFPTILEQNKIKYTLNKSDKEIHIRNYGKIIFRSMENPETIVGYEVAYSLIDEADILNTDKMEKVYQKILGRNRAIKNAGVDAVSTPEGFKWLYDQSQKGHFKVIRARTYDNKFLPPDYITRLEEQYPPNLLKAYLEGEFVNLTSGTIFDYFDRKRHNTDIIENDSEALYISQDFNVGGCISTVYVKRLINGIVKLIQVYEIESYDTKAIITNIKHTYPNRVINMYPDASSASRKTSASETDLQMLRGAGFNVFVNGRNPSVRDRIVITNNCFDKDIVLVNVNRCPKTAKAYEQHSYDEKGQPMKFNGAGTVDDFTDAATYILAYLFPIGHKIQKIGMTGV